MGIEPFLVGSALDCVLAQRLARRLCTQVQGAVRPDARDAGRRPVPVAGRASRCPRCYRAVGCASVRQDRLQGPAGAARGHAGERGDRAAHRRARLGVDHQRGGHRRGHGDAARGRAWSRSRRGSRRWTRSCASWSEAVGSNYRSGSSGRGERPMPRRTTDQARAVGRDREGGRCGDLRVQRGIRPGTESGPGSGRVRPAVVAVGRRVAAAASGRGPAAAHPVPGGGTRRPRRRPSRSCRSTTSARPRRPRCSGCLTPPRCSPPRPSRRSR